MSDNEILEKLGSLVGDVRFKALLEYIRQEIDRRTKLTLKSPSFDIFQYNRGFIEGLESISVLMMDRVNNYKTNRKETA